MNENDFVCCTFEVKFEDDGAFSIGFDGLQTIYVSGDSYVGEYDIVPATYEAKVLPTKNRFMSDDVTVAKIPTYEVSNGAGGATLIIGNESMF